jgi:glycosyltransferase involved in cell wall biosynthesis
MEDGMKSLSGPRVALISVGLGRVQRGFERWCSDLYGVLRGKLECTLYRSAGGESRGERIPPLLGTSNVLFRQLPISRGEQAEYKRDCAAFGFSLLPELLFRQFDVIHCVDPPMAQVLRRIQSILHLRSRILFTEGSALTPANLPSTDHLHMVAQVAYDQAVAYGIQRSNVTLVPSGVHTGRFALTASRSELRRKWGVSDDTFVVLAVSALRRAHKRIDYVIDEAARLPGDVLLWLDGHVEDPDLPGVAARQMGDRCRVTHVDTAQVAELYCLADVMVQGSLNEAFGLSVVEALASGVMVLAHRSPHFEWLVGDAECLIDMSQPGCLAERLGKLASQRATLCRRSAQRGWRVRERFDWDSLVPEYLEMYAAVAAKSPARRVA